MRPSHLRSAIASALAVAALALVAGAADARSDPWFDSVAEEAGIHVYYWGEGLESTPSERVGGGVCWGDFDGDGYEDLFFSKTNLNNSVLRELHKPKSQLYRNNGDGTFTDVSAGSGAGIISWGLGCSVADYDSDGDLDLMYQGHSEVTLLRNDGPFAFTNVTLDAGVSTIGKCLPWPCFTTGSAWGDVNRDGCLDLYLANYGNFSVDAPVDPVEYPGQANVYFESRCDGTFVDRSYELNLEDDPTHNHSRSFQPMFFDHNDDGRLDLYITSDGAPNSLLQQQADGTFVNVAWALGVADSRAGMGLEADDVDGDGFEDLYMTHYLYQNNGFYLGREDGGFRDISGTGNLSSDLMDLAWGTGFVDFDNDGRKDLYAVNGHTHFFPEYQNFSRRLYLQNPGGDFRDVTTTSGPGITMMRNSRGSAWADYDFDGDVDVVIENVSNQTSDLIRASNVTGNWLEVQLRDPASTNAFAVGAAVTVHPEGLATPQHRVLHSGASFLSQNSYTLHFGLGDATRATVSVRWPDGGVTDHGAIEGNRVVRLTRGAAGVEDDVLAPVTAAAVAGPQHDGWFTSPPNVTLAATDRGVTRVSGVERIEYRVDDGPWTTYGGPFAVDEGERVVAYRAHDVAGNAEPVRTLSLRVDRTRPNVTLDVDAPVATTWRAEWFTALPTVTVEGVDATSGVARLEHRLDWGAWTAEDEPFVLDAADGTHLLEARAVDRAGHESATASRWFRLDARPPTTRLNPVGPSLDRGDVLDVTSETWIRLVADDALGSGVMRTHYRVDGGEWHGWRDRPLNGSDREMLLEWRSVDEVGHVEPTRAQRIFLDNHRPPEVHPVSPVPGRAYAGGLLVANADAALDFAVVAGTVPVVAHAGQDVSGVAWTRVLVDGVERARAAGDRLEWAWDTTLETPGWHELAYESADGRGNVGRVAVRVLALGAGAP